MDDTAQKQFHAISLSGGKDSTAMLLLMMERDMPVSYTHLEYSAADQSKAQNRRPVSDHGE